MDIHEIRNRSIKTAYVRELDKKKRMKTADEQTHNQAIIVINLFQSNRYLSNF